MTARVTVVGLFLCAMAAPVSVSSQVANTPASVSDTALRRSCFRGHAKPRCDTFWLTEFGIAKQLTNDRYSNSYGPLVTWELGGMRNLGRRYALGAAAFADAGTPSSGLGIRPRVRVWLGDNNSIDVAPGMVLTGSNTGPSFSGHVAFNVADYAAITVHVAGVQEQTYVLGSNSELLLIDQKTRAVVFAGARLGSKPGSVAAIVFPVALFALYFLVCHGGCGD